MEAARLLASVTRVAYVPGRASVWDFAPVVTYTTCHKGHVTAFCFSCSSSCAHVSAVDVFVSSISVLLSSLRRRSKHSAVTSNILPTFYFLMQLGRADSTAVSKGNKKASLHYQFYVLIDSCYLVARLPCAYVICLWSNVSCRLSRSRPLYYS